MNQTTNSRIPASPAMHPAPSGLQLLTASVQKPMMPNLQCVNAVPSMRMNLPLPLPLSALLVGPTPQTRNYHGLQTRRARLERGRRRGQFNLHRDLIGHVRSNIFFFPLPLVASIPTPARLSLPLAPDRTPQRNDSDHPGRPRWHVGAN